jgi:tetratricopeptide (TPR) repeat protein
MNSSRTFFLLLLALLIFCFGLAAGLQPQFQALENSRKQSDNFFRLLLGDSSRMFANSFFVKADEYYHSGFYPTIFDNNAAFKTAHVAEDTGAVNSKNQGEETGFMGAPRDWLDAFGRHFIPNRHTHLDEGGAADDLSGSDQVREILPWLKLSTNLDPQNVQNYTVTAYWLRQRLHKTAEANEVLLEGLRNNPGNCDILFELGRLYAESDHDTNRAENVWIAAAKNWRPVEGNDDAKYANDFIYEKIATQLAETELKAGHWPQAIQWFQAAQKVSSTPDALQARIDEIKTEMAVPNKAALQLRN